MENIDDLEKEMNTDAELTRIDKEITNLADQWNKAETDRALIYCSDLGGGRVHIIQAHTSCEDTVAVCAQILRRMIKKIPEELRPVIRASIISTIANELK